MSVNSIGYDAGKIIIKVKSSLIKSYFPNLYGMFISSGDSKDIEITRESESSAVIRVSIEDVPESSEVDHQPSSMFPSYSPQVMKSIEKYKNILNDFYNSAMRREHRITEILPLSGYDAEDLKKDVMRAVQEKKKFCIIKSYDEYLSQSKTPMPSYHQVVLEYGTKEYIDAAILFLEKDLSKLNEIYKNKLVLENWFN